MILPDQFEERCGTSFWKQLVGVEPEIGQMTTRWYIGYVAEVVGLMFPSAECIIAFSKIVEQ